MLLFHNLCVACFHMLRLRISPFSWGDLFNWLFLNEGLLGFNFLFTVFLTILVLFFNHTNRVFIRSLDLVSCLFLLRLFLLHRLVFLG